MVRQTPFFAAAICLVWVASCVGQDASSQLESAQLGSTRNVHSFGNTLLCGQPSTEDLVAAKKRGIKIVVSLREESEIDWDESASVRDLGLEFHQLGFRSPESLTEEILDQSLRLLADSKATPVMLHCASANRVGAIWLAHRVMNDKVAIEQATEEAKTVGLRTAGYEEAVRKYIKSRSAD